MSRIEKKRKRNKKFKIICCALAFSLGFKLTSLGTKALFMDKLDIENNIKLSTGDVDLFSNNKSINVSDKNSQKNNKFILKNTGTLNQKLEFSIKLDNNKKADFDYILLLNDSKLKITKEQINKGRAVLMENYILKPNQELNVEVWFDKFSKKHKNFTLIVKAKQVGFSDDSNSFYDIVEIKNKQVKNKLNENIDINSENNIEENTKEDEKLEGNKSEDVILNISEESNGLEIEENNKNASNASNETTSIDEIETKEDGNISESNEVLDE